MSQHKDIKLLVVDSVTSLYKAEYIGRNTLSKRQQRLNHHMLMLRRFSEIYKVAVVITNQVNQSPEEFPGPFPRPVMAHASTYRIRLRQLGYHRIADLIHSPYLPEGSVYFGISKQGVCDVPKPEPLK